MCQEHLHLIDGTSTRKRLEGRPVHRIVNSECMSNILIGYLARVIPAEGANRDGSGYGRSESQKATDCRKRILPFFLLLTQPPLRDRIGDIPLLAEHYLQMSIEQTGRKLSGIDEMAMQALQHYHWPGNVRELVNVIARAVVLSRFRR